MPLLDTGTFTESHHQHGWYAKYGSICSLRMSMKWNCKNNRTPKLRTSSARTPIAAAPVGGVSARVREVYYR